MSSTNTDYGALEPETAHAALPEPELFTPEQACHYMQISVNMIYGMLRRGELASVKRGRSRRIPRSEIQRWINDNTHTGIAS